jgi:Protein of unknown function (DUF2442)
MNTLASALRCDDDSLWVTLADGRVIGAPLAWFPRLLKASPAEREKVVFSHRGLHWEDLDEDISIDGLLAGFGDHTRAPLQAANL